jgi:hypothetical protein
MWSINVVYDVGQDRNFSFPLTSLVGTHHCSPHLIHYFEVQVSQQYGVGEAYVHVSETRTCSYTILWAGFCSSYDPPTTKFI